MKKTIQRYIKRLNSSLGRSALLNVGLQKNTTSRVDMSSLSVTGIEPSEVIKAVLFGEQKEFILDLKLAQSEDLSERKAKERLLAIFRNSIEKKSTFVFRETGLRSLWFLYPVIYVRAPNPDAQAVGDVFAPVFLWPITMDTRSAGFGKIRIAADHASTEPIFNRALSFWIFKHFQQEVDEALSELTMTEFGKRISQTFSKIDSEPFDLQGPLVKLPQKKDLQDGKSPLPLNCAALGVLQWHNQELMKDLQELVKMEAEGGLEGNPVENFLSGQAFSYKDESEPSEEDRYLVRHTDYTQEKAIWQSRQAPGLVIEGPPGTGKSQTIVNIVADALAHNQRVLMLCQKRAALDVVAERLNAVRLNDFYLCIHDAESDRQKTIKKIEGILNAVAADAQHTPTDAHQSLSHQITAVEQKLDSYHKALFQTDKRVGLSYRDIIIKIRDIHRASSTLRPQDGLREILGRLDYDALKSLQSPVVSTAQHWTSSDLLNNPWSNARDNVEIDAFTITEIREVFDRLSILDREHAAFVDDRGAGCHVDEPVENFIEAGTKLKRCIAEKSRIEGIWMHLVAWYKLLGEEEASTLDELINRLGNAIRVTAEAREMPLDPKFEENFRELSADDIGPFLAAAAEIAYYRKKWWRDFSGKYSSLRISLKPLFQCLNEQFSFDGVDALVSFLKAKLKELEKQRLLTELFREQVHDLPPSDASRLIDVLSEKREAAKLYALFLGHKDTLTLIASVWTAISQGQNPELESVLESLQIGLERAELCRPIFAQLDKLRNWLEQSFVENLMKNVSNGVPIESTIVALQRGLASLETILSLRSQKRSMDSGTLKVIEFLENRFTEEAHSDEAPVTCSPDNWWNLCELCAYTEWQKEIRRRSPPIQVFSEQSYNQARDDLRKCLEQKRQAVVPAIGHRVLKARKQAVSPSWNTLLAVAGKGSKRLRQIVDLGESLGLFDLVPCWMMNPNTASRLFPLRKSYFDLVIFDEASQCPIEQAIPAIFRSKRTVVAGDDKQLPPTSFFHSSLDWEEIDAQTEEAFGHVEELDSDQMIEAKMKKLGQELAEGVDDLLEASKPLLPSRMLEIHYRSRWPELIEFSNHAFYQGRLQAPPSAENGDNAFRPPIVFRHLDSGVYHNKTNKHEADAIIRILEEIFERPGVPPTLGVVTFNQPQCDLIERLLDEYAEQNEEFGAKYYQQRQRKSGEQDVGLFVKNLENVQGDERDLMIFSTTFGRKDDGSFQRYFGPINFDGGERRLNVAITRSRAQKIIVTSMPVNEISPRVFSDDLSPGESYSGRDYLQLYVLYARAISQGRSDEAKAILDRARKIAQVAGLVSETGAPETEFEAEVKEALEMYWFSGNWTDASFC